jgi:hypothetical protein
VAPSLKCSDLKSSFLLFLMILFEYFYIKKQLIACLRHEFEGKTLFI